MNEPFIYSKIGFKRKWLFFLVALFLLNNATYLNAQEAIQVSGWIFRFDCARHFGQNVPI